MFLFTNKWNPKHTPEISKPLIIDYKRMERLRPPENTVIPINENSHA